MVVVEFAIAVLGGHLLADVTGVPALSSDATSVLLLQIYLPALQLLPNTEPRSVLLPLQGAASSKAALHVSVVWLKSTRLRQSSTGGSTPAAAPADAANRAASSASTPVMSGPPSPLPAAAAAAAARQHSTTGKSVTWHDEVGMCLQLGCLLAMAIYCMDAAGSRRFPTRTAGGTTVCVLQASSLG
jgi:hypothetical protein